MRLKRMLQCAGLAACLLLSVPWAQARTLPQELVGQWRIPRDGTIVELRPDGTLLSGGETGRWWTEGSVLVFQDPKTGETMRFTYRLQGDKLYLQYRGQMGYFVRVGPAPRAGIQPPNPAPNNPWSPQLPGPSPAQPPSGTLVPPPGASQPPAVGSPRPQQPAARLDRRQARAQLLRSLGQTRPFHLFALSLPLPAAWKPESDTWTAPRNSKLFRKEVPAAKAGSNTFGLPVLVGLGLNAQAQSPAAVQARLSRWTQTILLERVADFYETKFEGLRWTTRKYVPQSGAGRHAGLLILQGQTPDARLTLLALASTRGPHIVYLGSGLVAGSLFGRLDRPGQIAAIQAFQSLARTLATLAALAQVKVGPRDQRWERFLVRKGRFYYEDETSFYSWSPNGSSYSSYFAKFEIRFLPGPRCTVRVKTSGGTSFTEQRTTAFRDTTNMGDAHAQGQGPSALALPCEVRVGSGGGRWLLVSFPDNLGGPGFFRLERRGSEKCGGRAYHGLSIDGQVEGRYLTNNGRCTRSNP